VRRGCLGFSRWSAYSGDWQGDTAVERRVSLAGAHTTLKCFVCGMRFEPDLTSATADLSRRFIVSAAIKRLLVWPEV
jgi:hypothetical protein